MLHFFAPQSTFLAPNINAFSKRTILILLEARKMVTMPPLAILFALLGSTFAQSCDPSIYVEKIHSWNKVEMTIRSDLAFDIWLGSKPAAWCTMHPDTFKIT